MKALHISLLLFLLLVWGAAAHADEFFSITKIVSVTEAPDDGTGVHIQQKDPQTGEIQEIFVPYLKVEVKTAQNLPSREAWSKVYFYDENNERIAAVLSPSPGRHENGIRRPIPASYFANKPETLFFAFPEKLKKGKWSAVIIFGDHDEMKAAVYSDMTGGDGRPKECQVSDFDFAEKQICLNPPTEAMARKPGFSPLVEYPVKDDQGKTLITLVLRFPIGTSDGSQANGVLALSAVANGVEDMKYQLLNETSNPAFVNILNFADNHKLLILGWGCRRQWDPMLDDDEMDPKDAEVMKASLKEASDAWARGVDELSEKYHFPNKGFYGWGSSGGAQYLVRIALRKPQYFAAIRAHIVSSFEAPTSEANKIFWCLTTGELEPGYQRSIRFYNKSRELGYPIVYKAYAGLGHSDSTRSETFALMCFEYIWRTLNPSVLSSVTEDDEGQLATQADKKPVENVKEISWGDIFQKAPYIGDLLNQDFVTAAQQGSVSPELKVMLPTAEIARAWRK